jgi:hypothetical protein
MYADPGHGWVKVPFKLLRQLDIVDDISMFSYMKNNNVYLEEDMDYPLFFKKMIAKGLHVDLDVKQTERSSRIRSYHHYDAHYMRHYSQ